MHGRLTHIRDARRVRPWLAVALSSVIATACGSGATGSQSKPAPDGRQAVYVVSTECSASTPGSRTSSAVIGSCLFVASNGQRFQCSSPSLVSAPSLSRLEQSKLCSRLSPIKIPPPQRRVITTVEKARACLTSYRLRTAGGPMLLGESSPFTGPNGELIINGAFILFYTDAAEAKLFSKRLDASAARIGGTVEPHGAVAVVWTRPPGAAVRTAVNTCALS